MSPQEFEGWFAAHCAAFPAIQAWLGTVTDAKATLAVWQDILSDVEAESAHQATKLMARGDIEPPAAYDRERTAALIRRAAKKITFDKRQAKRDAANRKEATQRGKCQPLGPLIRRAMSIGYRYRDGEITEQQRDEMMEQVRKEAGSDPNAAEPRYTCGVCLDRGWVGVWHLDVVAEVRTSRKEPARVMECAVACSCSRGTRFSEPPSGSGDAAMFRPLPRYDEAHHCQIRGGVGRDRAVKDLMDWLFGGEVAEGRYKAFDEWNETAGTPF